MFDRLTGRRCCCATEAFFGLGVMSFCRAVFQQRGRSASRCLPSRVEHRCGCHDENGCVVTSLTRSTKGRIGANRERGTKVDVWKVRRFARQLARTRQLLAQQQVECQTVARHTGRNVARLELSLSSVGCRVARHKTESWDGRPNIEAAKVEADVTGSQVNARILQIPRQD